MNAHKTSLGFFPTPLHELKNFSRPYKNHRIFIKRDDHTGLATGGNKTRKLEYLIGHALATGADTIITAGAQQSNHCRQTAAACAVKGLECHLLTGGSEPAQYTGNLLLSSLLGANIHFTGENRKGEDMDTLMDELKARGRNPYAVPYGGSNLIGAMGFIDAANELSGQLKESRLHMDYIFFASSSGAMQAGLVLGAAIHGLQTKLMPVNIDKEENIGQKLEDHIEKLVVEGCREFSIHKQEAIPQHTLIRDFDSAGYGVVTDCEKEAVQTLARQEGILLDPVYTARAFFGMMQYLKQGLLKPGSNVLFWHTGGIPATLHYGEKLRL